MSDPDLVGRKNVPGWNARTRRVDSAQRLMRQLKEARGSGADSEESSTDEEMAVQEELTKVEKKVSPSKETKRPESPLRTPEKREERKPEAKDVPEASAQGNESIVVPETRPVRDIIAEREQDRLRAEKEKERVAALSPRSTGAISPRSNPPSSPSSSAPPSTPLPAVPTLSASMDANKPTRSERKPERKSSSSKLSTGSEERKHRHKKSSSSSSSIPKLPKDEPVEEASVEKLAPSSEALEELEKLRAENARLQNELRKKEQIIAQLQNKLGAVLATASAVAPSATSTPVPDEKKKNRREASETPKAAVGGTYSYENLLKHKHANVTGLHEIEAERELSHREKLILEVITTEQSYVTGLDVLANVYLKALQEAAKKDGGSKLREEDVLSVFGNLEQLFLLNLTLLNDLEERVKHWREPGKDRIGDILVAYAPKTKPYGRFGGHYNESLKRIEELSKSNSVWRRALEELDEQVKSLDGLNLSSYFIMPVQRLPRYVLLIRDLLKQTPETHRDHKELTDAATRMSEAAATLNENIRAAESQVHMFEILERGGGFDRLVSNPKQYFGQRYWLRDDELAGVLDLGPAPFHDLEDVAANSDRTVIFPSSKRKIELITFNDILVLSPLVGKKVPPQEYHQPVSLMWILPVTNDLLDEMKLDESDKAVFSPAHSVFLRGPENRWLLAFQNSSKKSQWLADLSSIMRLRPEVEVEGDGLREGTYEFRHTTLGAYEGEWEHGTLLCCPTASVTTIYDGHWNARYRAGVGMVGDKFIGWKVNPNGVKVADEYALWDEGALNERDWQRLLTGAQVVVKGSGERFIEQGKLNTSLFRVRKGQIRVEKALEGSSKKQVLVTLGPGTVLGDTSVIPSMKAATADVVADNSEVELEAISISILFGLFRSDPTLSMRFYRQMARKLAAQLKGLHMPKAPVDDESMSERDSDDEEASSSASTAGGPSSTSASETPEATSKTDKEKTAKDSQGSSTKLRDVDPATLALLSKFHLPITEVLLKSSECLLKAVLKKVGTLHVFANHLCFECTVFGVSTADAYPLRDIAQLDADKKSKGIKMKLRDGKKSQFINIKDLDAFMSVLLPVWHEALRKDEAEGSHKRDDSKSEKSEKKSSKKRIKREATLKRSVTRQGSMASSTESLTSPGAQGEGAITMTPDDWNLLLEGAKLVGYADGQPIIEEGMAHQRIYQVAQGRCAITKKLDTGTVTLGYMESGALFGEMTFLEKGNATASVTAEGDAQIYIIEGYFINILFVDYPHLAVLMRIGRFYSYLATILAQRLSDREAQIQKQHQIHAQERRARRRAQKEKKEKEGK